MIPVALNPTFKSSPFTNLKSVWLWHVLCMVASISSTAGRRLISTTRNVLGSVDAISHTNAPWPTPSAVMCETPIMSCKYDSEMKWERPRCLIEQVLYCRVFACRVPGCWIVWMNTLIDLALSALTFVRMCNCRLSSQSWQISTCISISLIRGCVTINSPTLL